MRNCAVEFLLMYKDCVLLTALVEEVKQRTLGAEMPDALQDVDVDELGRRKVEPMVRAYSRKRNRNRY